LKHFEQATDKLKVRRIISIKGRLRGFKSYFKAFEKFIASIDTLHRVRKRVKGRRAKNRLHYIMEGPEAKFRQKI